VRAVAVMIAFGTLSSDETCKVEAVQTMQASDEPSSCTELVQ
jgi:hypothetical protein